MCLVTKATVEARKKQMLQRSALKVENDGLKKIAVQYFPSLFC